MSKIFLSYNYDADGGRMNDVRAMLGNPEMGSTRDAVHLAEPLPLTHDRDARIRDAIRSAMRDCDAVVCIVGSDTHNSPWIAYEVEVARSLGLEVVAVYGRGPRGGPPPALRGEVIHDWDPVAVSAAVTRAVSRRRPRR